MTGLAGPARDPFAVLGLRADDDLTDDDVRIAWRRIAAATHPDRADGGDPDRFALAAAAYTELRTGFGRNEARAGLETTAPAWAGIGAQTGARIRRAGSVRLLVRLAAAAVAAAAGVAAAGRGTAAAPALVAGALTWFLVTAYRAGSASTPGRGRSLPAWPGRTTTATTSRRRARREDRPAQAQAPGAPP